MNTVQEKIQELLEQLCAEGRERGIQVAAYHRGELIVDACAGVADKRTGAPVSSETLFPIFSITKGLFATVIHQLVDQERLSYSTRVAELWPEFGSHGKGAITVEHVLRHRAGVTKIPAHTSVNEVLVWKRMCEIVAARPLEWKPGTWCEYHGLTYGWILGEIARRVTGKMPDVLLREIVSEPLRITEIVMGLPAHDQREIAWLKELNYETPADDGSPLVIPLTMWPLAEWMNRDEGRRACLPAGSGIASARAIARHYAGLLPGGVDGVELLSPERIEIATEHTPLPEPPPENDPDHFGLGYSVGLREAELPDTGKVFGHGGHGGSMGFADRRTGLAFGMTRNLLQSESALREIVEKLRDEIG